MLQIPTLYLFGNKLIPFAPSSLLFGERDFRNWMQAHLSHSSKQREKNDM